MASIYTRWLGALAPATPAAWTEILRAPSAGTVVVRDLLVTNTAATAATEVAIRDRPLTRAGEIWWFYARSLSPGTMHYELRQVLRPGHALEAFAMETGVHVVVTGYVFDT